MKKISFLIMIALSVFIFNSCEDDKIGTEHINYVSFEASSYSFGVDLGASNDRDISIYSTQVTGAARTININVDLDASSADPTSYTVPATVTIPANSNEGILTVKVSDVNISEAGETLVLNLTATEGLLTGGNITLNIKQVCPLNEVLLSITFDDWPEETGWELIDNATGNVVDSAAIGDYAGETEFAKAFCIPDGSYTFTIFDAYGDGTGDYLLVYDGTVLASGGGFGDQESTSFDVSM